MKQFLILSFFLFSSLIGLSCNCTQVSSPEEAYGKADIVFVGKVINATTNWMSGGYKYIFMVERSWKMSADTLLYLKTPLERDCGMIFKKGESYLVYANKKFTAKQTTSCSGSKALAEASADLAMLGDGTKPQDPKMLMMSMWTVGIAMVGGMLLLAVVVLRSKFRKSEPRN